MIVVDASAIVAILAREADAERLKRVLSQVDGSAVFVPSTTILEAALSLARAKSSSASGRKPTPADVRAAHAVVRAFITANEFQEIAVDASIIDAAIEAAATFGKAIGHAADLNFGDCLAYGCAKRRGAALLYIGNDFAKTDLA